MVLATSFYYFHSHSTESMGDRLYTPSGYTRRIILIFLSFRVSQFTKIFFQLAHLPLDTSKKKEKNSIQFPQMLMLLFPFSILIMRMTIWYVLRKKRRKTYRRDEKFIFVSFSEPQLFFDSLFFFPHSPTLGIFFSFVAVNPFFIVIFFCCSPICLHIPCATLGSWEIYKRMMWMRKSWNDFHYASVLNHAWHKLWALMILY